MKKQINCITLSVLTTILLCACSVNKITIPTTSDNKTDTVSSSTDPSSEASVTASLKETITETGSSESKEAETINPLKARMVLNDFLTADSLHMKCLVTYSTYTVSPPDPKPFEIWTKGLKYRSDEYQKDSVKFIIIVKDGDVKQYNMSTKKSFVPVWPPENYTDYYKWDASKIDEGTISSDGGYIVFTINGIDKFYKTEAAQAGFYYTKVEFGVNNNSVIYQTIYCNSSYGEKPSRVNAVTQTYEFVNINENFSDSVFNAPF